jgi:hypothetical protein
VDKPAAKEVVKKAGKKAHSQDLKQDDTSSDLPWN